MRDCKPTRLAPAGWLPPPGGGAGLALTRGGTVNKQRLRHYYNKDEGRWHHVWHQSDLKKLDMCPEQARFIWSGAVNDIQGDGAALGTACHYAVEQVLNLKGADVSSVDYSVMLEAFDQGLSDITPTIEAWNSYKSVEKMSWVGQTKLDGWYKYVYPNLTYDGDRVEERFIEVFYEDDERVVTLAGQVDLIDAKYGVVDWKFPKRDYTKEKWQYERWDVQSTVYCWAMGLPQMTFFVMHGSNGDVSSMTVERGPQDFAFLRRKVEAACRLVEQSDLTVWPLNDAGWWCSEKWAPCWSVCKGKTTAASEDANG